MRILMGSLSRAVAGSVSHESSTKRRVVVSSGLKNVGRIARGKGSRKDAYKCCSRVSMVRIFVLKELLDGGWLSRYRWRGSLFRPIGN
jgi:hypothetical protein